MLLYVSSASANRVYFPIRCDCRNRSSKPQSCRLISNSHDSDCRFYPAVAWTVQLLFHSGGDVLQPAEVGNPTALIKHGGQCNLKHPVAIDRLGLYNRTKKIYLIQKHTQVFEKLVGNKKVRPNNPNDRIG